jgi:nitrilase
MKVAAIQMVSGISLDANLSEALRLITQAAHAGAELVEKFLKGAQHGGS